MPTKRNTKKKTKSNRSPNLKLSVKRSLGKRRRGPIYRGLGYDMLMSYIYIVNKYGSNLCIAIGDKETIKREYNPTYVGLIYERTGGSNKMVFHGGKEKLVEFIRRCNRRFFAIPLSLEYPDSGPHFNLLVGDRERKVLQRFEPYGGGIDEKVHDNFDKEMKELIKEYDLRLKYENPDQLYSGSGFQDVEETAINKKAASVRVNDYRGYCGMWGVWFLEMKLKNPQKTSRDIISESMKEIKKLEGMSFRNYIRNFKDDIVEKRKALMEKAGIKCRDPYTGFSPDYELFKKCAQQFLVKNLDNYF